MAAATLVQALTILTCLLAAIWPGAQARTDRVLITFGDSLTDTGLFFTQITKKRLPLPQFYFKGRFTNKPGVWADQVPQFNKRVQVENFAVGGATACDFPVPPPFDAIPAVYEQVQIYLRRLKTDRKFKQRVARKTRIPVIWIGHNDLALVAPSLPPAQAIQIPANTVQCILNATQALLSAGHKYVIIGNLAPINFAPLAIAKNLTGPATLAVAAVNQGLQAVATSLNQQYRSRKAQVLLWDVNKDIMAAVTNFKRFGFKFDNTQSCIKGAPDYSAALGSQPTSVCDKPNQYLFYDPFHPSSKSHAVIRNSILDVLVKAKLLKSRRY